MSHGSPPAAFGEIEEGEKKPPSRRVRRTMPANFGQIFQLPPRLFLPAQDGDPSEMGKPLVQRRCRAAMTAQTRSRIRARSRWA